MIFIFISSVSRFYKKVRAFNSKEKNVTYWLCLMAIILLFKRNLFSLSLYYCNHTRCYSSLFWKAQFVNQGNISFLYQLNFLYLLPNIYHRAGGGLVMGASVAFLSSIAATQIGPQTLLVLNAGFLTLWYIECAIALTHGFFARLFEDALPFEIRLFVSFVVMINAGYFTLMFIVSLLRARVSLRDSG